MDGYLEKVWVWTWISIIHTHPVLLPSLSQTLSSIFLVIGFTSQQVGTTCFDALVKAADTLEVKQELTRTGYAHLLIQMGQGTYLPAESIGEDGLLAVDCFTFSSRSGSIFETLRLGKPLIVVVNEDLMDNHQSELAEELADRKHLYCAHPQSLHQVIAGMDLKSLLPYQPGDATPVAKLINRFLGFPDD